MTRLEMLLEFNRGNNMPKIFRIAGKRVIVFQCTKETFQMHKEQYANYSQTISRHQGMTWRNIPKDRITSIRVGDYIIMKCGKESFSAEISDIQPLPEGSILCGYNVNIQIAYLNVDRFSGSLETPLEEF